MLYEVITARECDDLCHAPQIAPVQHDVHHEREALRAHRAREGELALVCVDSRDGVAGIRVRVLDRELHAAQARRDERSELLPGARRAGGDEVRVELV